MPQEKQHPNSKRLAKNTFFMYFRMLLLMLITFYTARILLRELGIEDYGIYNVVGGIVAMLSSLRTLFSSSTQRFLNFEMGRGNVDALKKIFNTSLYINAFISILFVIVAEIIGLWFLYYKINMDMARFDAAMWVFQLSVISSVCGIFITSYDAEIIAHEKMDFYAYMSILEGGMKLMTVFILSAYGGDKLILYSILLFVVTLTAYFINVTYCHTKFQECSFDFHLNKKYIKEMTGFAVWNFFGKTSYALTQNGLNMVLNVFGGPAVNTARGIALQLNAATNQFLNNMNIVLNPYSIKLYANKQHDKFFKIMFISSKIYFFLQLLLVIPISLLAEWILKIWLNQVPTYTIQFLQLILIWSLIRSLHAPLDTLFKAQGNMKQYQIIEGVLLVFPIPFGWLALKYGLPFYWVFVIVNIFEIINLFSISFWAHRIAGLPLRAYLTNVLVLSFACSLPFACIFAIDMIIEPNPQIKFLETLFCEIISALSLFYIALTKEERLSIIHIIK